MINLEKDKESAWTKVLRWWALVSDGIPIKEQAMI